MTAFLNIIGIALIPTLAILLSAGILLTKKSVDFFADAFQSFAVGALLSVVLVKLLPDVVRHHRTLETSIGLVIGVTVVLLINYFFDRQKKNKINTNDTLLKSFVVKISTNIAIDGVVLGIGFWFGETESILLAITLSIQMISCGLFIINMCKEIGISSSGSILLLALLAASFLSIVLISKVVIAQFPEPVVKIVLPFGAALLFTKLLITEVSESKSFQNQNTFLFIGFTFCLILGWLL